RLCPCIIVARQFPGGRRHCPDSNPPGQLAFERRPDDLPMLSNANRRSPDPVVVLIGKRAEPSLEFRTVPGELPLRICNGLLTVPTPVIHAAVARHKSAWVTEAQWIVVNIRVSIVALSVTRVRDCRIGGEESARDRILNPAVHVIQSHGAEHRLPSVP